MQPDQNPEIDPAASAGGSDDGEVFSPEDWVLHDGIQDPEAFPKGPPKRELPPENEDEQHDT